MPVRIELRLTQLCRNALFESFRNEMFKALGFLVNLFQRIVEHLIEKCFNQAMMSQHLECPSLSRR